MDREGDSAMKKTKKQIISTLLILALVLSLSVTAFAATGTWKKNSIGWWYSYSTGGYAANKWEKIDGKWYHFNAGDTWKPDGSVTEATGIIWMRQAP